MMRSEFQILLSGYDMKRLLQKMWVFCFTVVSITSQAASLPPVIGKTAMVVSAQHHASQVGMDILNRGGNAIDAAVAMGYALAVVEPSAGNIGGGGFMLIRFADGRKTVLNFREKAPHAINPEMFSEGDNVFSGGYVSGRVPKPYLSVGVPGTVKGLNLALKKYGTFTLPAVIYPAIHLAESGYILKHSDADFLAKQRDVFIKQPNVAKIFLNKNKQAFGAGDKVVQKNLAKTLRKIAKYGDRVFYQGEIADAIVKASRANGGVLSKQDFLNYTVEEMQPISCDYRGYKVLTIAPPSAGGVTICESLNIMDGYDMADLGYHSAASVHNLVEALRYSYADRSSFFGDPDFVKNPTEKLISKKYADEIRAKILGDVAGDSSKIGFSAQLPEKDHTTAYAVVDKDGTAVSVTYTLNDYFGSRVIAGDTGFFLNNELADFSLSKNKPNTFGLVQGDNNLIGPDKRPVSSMAPTILLKKGKVALVIGTPGGSTIPSQLIGVIQNIIDYNMDVQQAVDAPRVHMQWLPDMIFVEPYSLSRDSSQLLRKMGYKIKVGSPYGTQYWGGVVAIQVDDRTKQLKGAVDARRPAGAAIGN